METLESTRNSVEEQLVHYILEKYKPRAIVLHGSRAAGYGTPTSDWDFHLFVDERKDPVRGFVGSENVEFGQTQLPVDVAKAFDLFGLKFRRGNVRILYDPEGIAEPLIKACQTEIEKGFEFTPEDKESRKGFMEGMLSKMQRYEHEEFLRLQFVGEFLSRANNSWFPSKEKVYSLPPYQALPHMQEKDPEFISLLNQFALAHGAEQQALGRDIISYLFT